MNQSHTLQELVQAVADNLHDLVPGVTTAGTSASNKLTDATKAGRRPNHWQSSEIVFLEPDATVGGRTGTNPFVVTAYTDGSFTLDHDFGGAGIPANLPFFIVRNHGQGHPYRAYVRAIKRAIDNLGISSHVEDQNVVTEEGVYTYPISDALDTIHTVELLDYSQPTPYVLRPDQWSLYPGRTLRLTHEVTVARPWVLTLRGRKFGGFPDSLDATVTADLDEVVDFASEALNRGSNRPVDQAKGQSLQAERLRYKRRHAMTNEQLIIP